jgi:DNA-binding response OmpR family regulator
METARILVAEQERELRSTLRHGLQLAGYLVAEAPDGRQAIEIVREEPPELILLDLAITAVGSTTLLAELLTMHLVPHTRVIVLTEPTTIAVAIEALRLGASDFLEKPVALVDVQASIASVLNECPPKTEEVEDASEGVFQALRGALRAGRFAAAEAALMKPDPVTDAGVLNLAGILQEAHRRVADAKKFYERAVKADGHYRPARENLKRLTELNDVGLTRRAVTFANTPATSRVLMFS